MDGRRRQRADTAVEPRSHGDRSRARVVSRRRPHRRLRHIQEGLLVSGYRGHFPDRREDRNRDQVPDARLRDGVSAPIVLVRRRPAVLLRVSAAWRTPHLVGSRLRRRSNAVEQHRRGVQRLRRRSERGGVRLRQVVGDGRERHLLPAGDRRTGAAPDALRD